MMMNNVYVVEKEGTGAKPNINSIVKVKYTGKILATGKTFDSTDKNPEAKGGVEFPLNQVIYCTFAATNCLSCAFCRSQRPCKSSKKCKK